MKQVVILAGGKGTRLRERLGDQPKPLIDVCGMPLLERQILLAKRYGFTSVIILVNYRAERIVEFCLSKGNWGLDVECVDDGEPRGTAGAVLNILDKLEPEFLLMYGDTMLEVDMDRFQRFHTEGGHDIAATLFLHPNDHPHDSDLVEIDEDGRVAGFYPYPHEDGRYYPNLVNAALYWIRRDALEPWRGHVGGLDFGKELFPAMIERGMVLRGYNSPEYIKDCGTPARIDKVCGDFEAGRIQRAGLGCPQRAVFVDRDGTLNREVNHLNDPEQLELLPGTVRAIRRLNATEYRVCVVTNQPVIARGECSVSTLRQIHNKLETLLGRDGAYVDRIYYCPHHPDKGFAGEVTDLKVDCSCRKPKTGLIEAAAAELNIDLGQSWLVGDTSSDVLTARRAGVRSILVETGYAGLDQKYFAVPDYVFPDFAAAVDFIIDGHPRLMDRLTPFAEALDPGALVLVGGQSRSGKSTLASALRDRLLQMGQATHVISTDRWIRSDVRREEGVLGRHDMGALTSFAKAMTTVDRPYSVSLPGYKKASREQVQDVEVVRIGGGDIVILEGVVALALAEIVPSAARLFVGVDEDVRRSRVIREYVSRGMGVAAAAKVYQNRMGDEYDVVAQSAVRATRFQMKERLPGIWSNDY